MIGETLVVALVAVLQEDDEGEKRQKQEKH